MPTNTANPTKQPGLWTVRDLDEALTAICRAHPNWVNPRSEFGCVYEWNDRYCLIGQFLKDHGFPVPAFNASGAKTIFLELGFHADVAERAQHWQGIADAVNEVYVDPRAWGTVPRLVLDR